MGYDSSVIKIDCQPKLLLQDIHARYYLTTTLDNLFEDMMTYIMMNPSKADLNQSDATVDKVIEFANAQTNDALNSFNVGVVSIVNLFGVYKTDSNFLQPTLDLLKANSSIYNQMIIDNRSTINDCISKSKYIVLAWGNVPPNMSAKTHNEEVLKVYESLETNEKLDSVYVLKSPSENHNTVLTKKKRPRHPNRITPIEFVKCENIFIKRNFVYIELNNNN